MFHLREFGELGDLIACGQDRTDMFRRAASYVAKVLKGAKLGDLSIERPVAFEVVVNLITAKALCLDNSAVANSAYGQVIE